SRVRCPSGGPPLPRCPVRCWVGAPIRYALVLTTVNRVVTIHAHGEGDGGAAGLNVDRARVDPGVADALLRKEPRAQARAPGRAGGELRPAVRAVERVRTRCAGV